MNKNRSVVIMDRNHVVIALEDYEKLRSMAKESDEFIAKLEDAHEQELTNTRAEYLEQMNDILDLGKAVTFGSSYLQIKLPQALKERIIEATIKEYDLEEYRDLVADRINHQEMYIWDIADKDKYEAERAERAEDKAELEKDPF